MCLAPLFPAPAWPHGDILIIVRCAWALHLVDLEATVSFNISETAQKAPFVILKDF